MESWYSPLFPEIPVFLAVWIIFSILLLKNDDDAISCALKFFSLSFFFLAVLLSYIGFVCIPFWLGA